MTFAPASIKSLAAFWTRQGGVNLGIVGDSRHRQGYHLGEDRIFDGSGPGLGGADYSVQTSRDKAGLSEAASAIDLGKLDGSYTRLYKFSSWLVTRCRANAAGTRDIREVIYSPDGVKVLRWDRQRGYSSAPRAGEADESHRWHTHISFYRDSENRDKVGIFAPYFAPAVPDTSTEDTSMPVLATYLPGYTATVGSSDGANVRSGPKLGADLLRTIPAGTTESWRIVGWAKGDSFAGSTDWLVRWHVKSGRWEYVHRSNVKGVAEPGDDSPFTKAQLDAAVKAAVDPLNKKIAAAKAALG